MAGKQPEQKYPSTSVFRDSNAQKKYREQSTSQYKDEKEASHIVSLQIVKEALNNYRPQGRPPVDEPIVVTAFFNDPSNLRMVMSETNREEHVRLDNAIIAKAGTGEELEDDEEDRARRQVTVIQELQRSKHADKLKSVTYECFKEFYKKLKTKSGKVVWDARHDD